MLFDYQGTAEDFVKVQKSYDLTFLQEEYCLHLSVNL